MDELDMYMRNLENAGILEGWSEFMDGEKKQTSDTVSRALVLDAIMRVRGIGKKVYDRIVEAVEQVPSAEEVRTRDEEFLEFLSNNVINPNDMEKYREMFESREEKGNGRVGRQA